jgi:hypothetical protein
MFLSINCIGAPTISVFLQLQDPVQLYRFFSFAKNIKVCPMNIQLCLNHLLWFWARFCHADMEAYFFRTTHKICLLPASHFSTMLTNVNMDVNMTLWAKQ